MATGAQAHRATAVGLSGGLGVALPLAALAVTLPFEEAHELVSSGAAPFAVGAVAGVGVLALTLHIMERRSEPAPAGTMGGAAAAQPEAQERPRAAKGVPVISRAANAMSDDEAWAELEAILAEDSPISCDPARSKDVYQIALEELARTQEHEAVPAAAPEAVTSAAPDAEVTNSLAVAEEDGAEEAAPAAPAESVAPASPADTTGVYLALAASCGITAASAADRAASLADDDEARDAAMASLGGASAAPAPAMPATAGVELVASAAASAAEPATAVLGEPATAASATAAPMPSAQDIWAQALAILAEEVEPPVQEVPRPRGAHFAPSTSEPQPVLPQVEGGISMQAHVDELVEEEFNRMRSRSSRRSGRPSLRVIQGGTTGVQPRLSAEA